MISVGKTGVRIGVLSVCAFPEAARRAERRGSGLRLIVSRALVYPRRVKMMVKWSEQVELYESTRRQASVPFVL